MLPSNKRRVAMKTCSKCKQEKEYDGFYKDRKAKDGYNGICKDCRREMDRERRKNDPCWAQKRKLQNHRYHMENREAIAERKKKWFESEVGKKSHRESSRKWKKQNTLKVLAHSAVERAVKRGELVPKERCEVCNSKHKIEAHHPDHRKKLQVIWLCKHCHEKL